MSKAVLVMDMPESCGNCIFKSSDYVDGTYYCGLIARMSTEMISVDDYVFYGNNRPDWCPLRPMPDKKKEDNSIVQYSREEVFAYQKGWNAGRAVGFNDCIDAIGGGDGE